ncbi:hypothetical protein H6P81_005762 [Aristolochia fimbriata]|uniref:Uncharacterized protein n=1 Tax=Aristolochia fimbriata TaxID=158543 RepID=A0AAV7EVJ2_ARIFI|nr:hypothetical protein H6P81_005762 [Aristolochia fimbriata]
MRKKTSAKSSSTHLATSPKPPKPVDFDINLFSASKKPGSASKRPRSVSPLLQPVTSPLHKPVASIADVKDLASSHADSIKRHLELSHSKVLRDIDAYACRISKRFKIQIQECQQLMDEADREQKNLDERIHQNMTEMKASYAEFISDTQATASRVCKVSITELRQSAERAIESLRSRYRMTSAPV